MLCLFEWTKQVYDFWRFIHKYWNYPPPPPPPRHPKKIESEKHPKQLFTTEIKADINKHLNNS